jgi:hypothetical protein
LRFIRTGRDIVPGIKGKTCVTIKAGNLNFYSFAWPADEVPGYFGFTHLKT